MTDVAHKYAEANNKYLPVHDPIKPSNYIMYLNANYLYGWALSQSLPYDDFKFIDPHPSLSKYNGYIFEVDLKYSEELHNTDIDYPLAPIKSTEKLLLTIEYKKMHSSLRGLK
ncbi:unnamed protein product [Ixodes persulcatus]